MIYDPRVAGAPVAFDAFARPVELPPQPAAGGTALQWAFSALFVCVCVCAYITICRKERVPLFGRLFSQVFRT